MMDDYPLALVRIVDRAERIHGQRQVLWRRPSAETAMRERIAETTADPLAGAAKPD